MEKSENICCLRSLINLNVQEISAGEVMLKGLLPEWVGKENCNSVKLILHDYLDLIETHIEELAIICAREEILSSAANDNIIVSLLPSLEFNLLRCGSPEVKDVYLVAALQIINHVKISLYGSLAAFASSLRLGKAGMFFHQAELDEKNIDDRLSYLAEHILNRSAVDPASNREQIKL